MPSEKLPRQKDLLRWTVHLLLTVYLLPAICLVILVSLIAVLADGWTRALVRYRSWLRSTPAQRPGPFDPASRRRRVAHLSRAER